MHLNILVYVHYKYFYLLYPDGATRHLLFGSSYRVNDDALTKYYAGYGYKNDLTN